MTIRSVCTCTHVPPDSLRSVNWNWLNVDCHVNFCHLSGTFWTLCRLYFLKYNITALISSESQSYLGLHKKRHGQQGGGSYSPLPSPPLPSWSSAFSFRTQEIHGLDRVRPEEGHRPESWNTSPMNKAWESSGSSAWRRKSSGETVFQYLKEAYKKDGERLFIRVCSDRTKGNCFKLKECNFWWTIGKYFFFFAMRVARH